MNSLRRLFGAALIAALGVLTIPESDAQDAAKTAPVSDPAALAIDQQIISEIREHSDIMKNLQYISDEIGHRLTGSPSLKKANDWTAAKMKEYGLTDVHLEAWEIPAGWERGTATLTLIDPTPGRQLTVAAMGWTPGTKGKISGDVVIIDAKTKDDLNKFKGKLKNAIILTRPPTEVRPITDLNYAKAGVPGKKDGPPSKEATPKTESAKLDPPKKDDAKKDGPIPSRPGNFGEQMALRRELGEFLRTEGAAVMLTDSGKPHGLLNMTGSWRGGDRASANEPLPTLFITHDHYALLYRLASRKDAVTKAEVEITNKTIPGPLPVYNTVGEIKGSEKPEEIVVVGAHLDSWDLASGTTDNGTGSSVVLEAARAIIKSGVKPKRTIRFVLFTGEEEGLYGSKAYVEKHKDEMAKTSCALVHDTGTGKVYGFGVQGRTSVLKILDPMSESLKSLPGFKEHTLRSMGGTDHLSFEAVGVPGFACEQDSAEYRFTHHSQSDTFDKAMEPDLIEGAQVMAVTAVRVANLPDLLPRDKPEGKGGGRRRENKEQPPAEKKSPAIEKKDAPPVQN
ncbi:M20/M25/M40 family metallo-hydrolase [Telmatocola sphagniphila]|uniref:Carboxypeptidase Q n=1 Tax=Telmatocola sphagniphila TaxID=1123043 RepID=A0A8E6B5T6_9BACT|nr:M20/M25/M40 family metallo-hydrolase [Telmatocola sphagniphila]QVL32427.1 M20/M25/M40 family metallo-hydrolase [Telmatocola sphagniphila]